MPKNNKQPKIKVDAKNPKRFIPGFQAQPGKGFHSKGSSQAGAYRQRSMGNRNIKPSKSK